MTIGTIGTLHPTLLHPTLVPASATQLKRIAAHYARNPNLGVLLRDTGERSWARLADDSGVELWLVSWPEDTETGWHDHGGSVGAFAVASGSVVEQTWATGAVRKRRLAAGDFRSFGVRHVHNVRGSAPGRSLTVHAYAPRLLTMNRHELSAQGPRPVGTTNEGAGW